MVEVPREYSGGGFGSNLVVVELAIAMVLLVGAGLLAKSFYRLLHVDMGFETDHLAVLGVELPPLSYSKPEQQVAVGREVVGRVRNLPRRRFRRDRQQITCERQWEHRLAPVRRQAL